MGLEAMSDVALRMHSVVQTIFLSLVSLAQWHRFDVAPCWRAFILLLATRVGTYTFPCDLQRL